MSIFYSSLIRTTYFGSFHSKVRFIMPSRDQQFHLVGTPISLIFNLINKIKQFTNYQWYIMYTWIPIFRFTCTPLNKFVYYGYTLTKILGYFLPFLVAYIYTFIYQYTTTY